MLLTEDTRSVVWEAGSRGIGLQIGAAVLCRAARKKGQLGEESGLSQDRRKNFKGKRTEGYGRARWEGASATRRKSRRAWLRRVPTATRKNLARRASSVARVASGDDDSFPPGSSTRGNCGS